MLQIALRGVRNNPFRYAATSLAIILGVAFFIATGVMTTSFRDSINGAIDDVFESIDAAVQSTETIDTGFFEFRQKIPAETADLFTEVDGVESAEAYVYGYAQVVTAEGKVVPGSQSVSGYGWIENPDLNPYYLMDGEAPDATNEIVIDEFTFDRGDFAVGDEVRVLPLSEDAPPFTIVGVITTDGAASSAEQVVSFNLEAAEMILGTTSGDQIFVAAEEGVTAEEVVANLQAAIDNADAPLEAVTGQDLADEYQELIGTFTGIIDTALKVFAGVALFVGAFVIYNTFSIIIAQRTKEMALLRAIGASGRQVSISVLVEALIVGLLASTLGALAGIGIAWGLLQLLSSLFGGFGIALVLPAGTLGFGVVIGTIITICAAWLPARRGARIAPIEALRDSEIEEVRAGTTRKIIGLGLMGGGLVAALAGVGVFGDASAWWLAGGLPAVVISIFLVAPILVRPVTRALAIPLVRNGQITGELSRENATRNPKRTATTSLTLMIGVALMVTAAVFAATLSQAVRGTLEDNIAATDIVTISGNIEAIGGGLDPSIAQAIAEIDGVAAAVPVRSGFAEVNDSFTIINATDTDTIDRVLNLDVIEGDLGSFDNSSIAVSSGSLRGLGDTIVADFQSGSREFTVTAVYDDNEMIGDYFIDVDALAELLPRALDTQILIDADDSAVVDQAIEAALATDPTANLKTTSQYITDQAGQVNNLLYLLYGLLGMAVVVALIGIVNTMALSIHERTRELGLLRAVGMTQRQMKRIVRYESALVALMGTVVGIILGLFFGYLVFLAGKDNLAGFVVPWAQLIIVTIVGIFAGVIAGVLPARRAAKLDVLEAISNE